MLIVGHTDTVAAGRMPRPFDGELSDGRIHGRGACDDKGPLAVALSVLIGLHREGEALAYDVTLAATTDEEGGMRGAKALARAAGPFDLCIALEPTSRRVVTEHKGVFRFVVAAEGRAAHSSRPQNGVNAVEAMLPIADRLLAYGRELSVPQDARLGRTTLTMTQLSGGTAPNVVPDHCELTVDVRLLPELDPAEVAQHISRICGPGAAIRPLLSCRGIRSDPEIPAVQALRDAVAREGGDPAPASAHYCTDCSQLAHLGPCVVWGPGDIALAHTEEESIELAEIEAGCRTLWRFLHG